MKLLSLDLSTSCSGWSVFQDGKLIEYGSIPEPTYKGKSKERYPIRSGKICSMMGQEIDNLIYQKYPTHIVIEEVSPNGIAGVKSIKGLCQLHGVILHLMYTNGYIDNFDITMLSPREWRGAVGLKKNGDFKASSVQLANKLFNLQLDSSGHDISDAILLGQGFLKLGGYLEKKV